MLDRIIKFSLANRVLIAAAALILMAVGLMVTQKTEVDVFPDLNAPTVAVMTEAPGMAPEEVEQLVTFPIETAMNGATGVRRVRSSSSAGFSVVWVEFDWGTDIYVDRQIVSEKLATIGDDLPIGAGTPVLGPQSSILGELLIVAMTGSEGISMEELRTLAEWNVRPRLLSVSGVSQVSVIGGDLKEYQVLADPLKMRHYGVTLDEILDATRAMTSPSNGGVYYEYGNEYIIRASGSPEVLENISQGVVKMVNGSPVTLADVAQIKTGAQSPRLGLASLEGAPAVLLTVTKQPATGSIELTAQLDAVVDDLRKTLPEGVEIRTDIFRQADFIESSIGNVKTSLWEGALFVVIILFVFLGNVRTTVISLVTIPLALVISLVTLHLMGHTINTMSLGGLAIAIGSLVDDAIVDVENVWRNLRENRRLAANERKPVLRVVYEASREVRMPILNSTLIIVVSFLPLFFLKGMEGRMLIPLGIAFIVALFASTLVALTLTPVLCSWLLNHGKKNDEAKEWGVSRWLKEKYGICLRWALAHGRLVTGTAVALFLASLGLFFTLGHSFLPAFNEGSFTVNVSTMPGVSLEESDRIGRRAEELLLTVPEIRTVARKTGRAELDEHALGVNTSEIEAPFVLGDRTHRDMLAEVREKLLQISGANIEIGQPISHRIDAMLSGTQASIAVKIFGEDLNQMFKIGNQIKEAVADVEGVVDLNVEQQIERPELKITPRMTMLARHGITVPVFNDAVSVLLGGEKVSQVYEGSRRFDLVVRAKEDSRNGIEEIKRMLVATGNGSFVPLGEIADIRSVVGPNTINRENVKRKIVVSANTHGRDMGSVVDEMRERISEKVELPAGCHIEYGGQFESEKEANRVLMWLSLLSIAVIYLLLFMQFRSGKESLLILANLPFALIGGVLVLWIGGRELSIPAIIGFISLFGIATRNGMLLVSRYDLLRSEGGMSVRESILKGSEDRLNPILMTALTSALALVPLAFRGDLPGNEIQSPMAVVILGGLISSTALNALIIPVMYGWLYRKNSAVVSH